MMKIVFHNLEKSELARDVTRQKLEHLYEQFPKLSRHRFVVTLSMENSPTKAGPDQFSVSARIDGPQFFGIQVVHREANLYLALAQISERLARLLSEETKIELRRRRRSARAVKVLAVSGKMLNGPS